MSNDPHESTGLNPMYMGKCHQCGGMTYPGLIHGCTTGIPSVTTIIRPFFIDVPVQDRALYLDSTPLKS